MKSRHRIKRTIQVTAVLLLTLGPGCVTGQNGGPGQDGEPGMAGPEVEIIHDRGFARQGYATGRNGSYAHWGCFQNRW